MHKSKELHIGPLLKCSHSH